MTKITMYCLEHWLQVPNKEQKLEDRNFSIRYRQSFNKAGWILNLDQFRIEKCHIFTRGCKQTQEQVNKICTVFSIIEQNL